jgi:large subunit ribosomal protein L21
MYAVIETGGKQYRVEVGTELQVELLDVEPGNTITLDRVLLVADGDEASIGQPLVANAAVSAEVVRQARGDKVIAFKYRPKARRRVKHGHRQELTVLRISDITLGGKSAAKAESKAAEAKETERQRAEAAAAEQAAADAALAAKLAERTKESEPAAKPKRSRAKAGPAEAAQDAAEAAEGAAEAAADAAGAEAPADEKVEATESKPKRTRAKAAEATTEAETPADETEAKPKRSRTTKKDE